MGWEYTICQVKDDYMARVWGERMSIKNANDITPGILQSSVAFFSHEIYNSVLPGETPTAVGGAGQDDRVL